MRIVILSFSLIITISVYSQNDSIHDERYNVINSLFKGRNIEKFGRVKLNKSFLKFLGLGTLITDPGFIDNLEGHCLDLDKKELYSYEDLVTQKERLEMSSQVDMFLRYPTIDSEKISEKIELVNDSVIFKLTISIPLVSNNKAFIYITNQNNEENLIVFEKIQNEWIIRCRKNLYVRFDD